MSAIGHGGSQALVYSDHVTRQLVVGAIILLDLDSPSPVLIGRRGAGDFAGQWEFPGGKVEPGETPEEALHRELSEELGVEIEIGAEFLRDGAQTWRINDRYRLRVWFVRIASGIAEPLDVHDELRWVPRAELAVLPWLPADRAIVDALTLDEQDRPHDPKAQNA